MTVDGAGHEATTSLEAADLEELTKIIERLASEPCGVSLGELTALVAQCHHDLSGSPRADLPELIDRLARQRLTTDGHGAAVDMAKRRRLNSQGASGDRAAAG